MFNTPFMLIILFATISFSNPNTIFDQYDFIEFDDSISEMSPAYTGPLVASGGAIANVGYIIDTIPEPIGTIESNKITLIDDPNEVYTFDYIKYYKVIKNIVDTFYIMKIDAQMNQFAYEIIIELKEGPNYDRTLNIYKDGKISTLILWVENTRLVPKKVNKI
jgi:hypothetical protein